MRKLLGKSLRYPARLLGKFLCLPPGSTQYPITLYPETQPTRGRVLFSYLPKPLLWAEDDERFRGHANNWRSREIAYIFSRLGYVVDAISWSDQQFTPTTKYDVIFDIHTNLQRLAPLMEKDTIKILHCTGSDPYYQNQAEIARVRDLEKRRKALYSPKRLVAYPDLAQKSLEIADACVLLGNHHTLQTYPEELRHKIHLVTSSASYLGNSAKTEQDYVPDKREFLWFFGAGAVHKGLDLLLEIFPKHQHCTLNVIGDIENEKDFFKIYGRELMNLPNIKYHGYLKPDCERFKEILRGVFCFIAPTCSEGISPAVVTCMQIGLYPIISRDTGVSLPEGCGRYLETCSIEEIEEAILKAHRMANKDLADQIGCIQRFATQKFSREAFREDIKCFLSKILR